MADIAIKGQKVIDRENALSKAERFFNHLADQINCFNENHREKWRITATLLKGEGVDGERSPFPPRLAVCLFSFHSRFQFQYRLFAHSLLSIADSRLKALAEKKIREVKRDIPELKALMLNPIVNARVIQMIAFHERRGAKNPEFEAKLLKVIDWK